MLTKVVLFALVGIAVGQHLHSDDGDDGSYSPEKYELPYENEVSNPQHQLFRPQPQQPHQPQQQYHYQPQQQYHQPQQQYHQPQPAPPQQWASQGYNNAVPNSKHAAILSESRYQSSDGKFGSQYSQEDGVEFKEESDPDGTRRGSYSYVDPSGQRRTISYTAGKHGFQATGDHLPQPVAPVPQYEHPSQYQHQPQY